MAASPLKLASAQVIKACLEAGSTVDALKLEGVDPTDALEMAASAHDIPPGHAMLYGVLIGMHYERTIKEATEEIAAPRVEVFSRPECVFNYCPHPEDCQRRCVSAR